MRNDTGNIPTAPHLVQVLVRVRGTQNQGNNRTKGHATRAVLVVPCKYPEKKLSPRKKNKTRKHTQTLVKHNQLQGL